MVLKAEYTKDFATMLFQRLIDEWRLPIYGLTDTNGKTIDLKLTFKPEPKIACTVVKLALFGVNIYAATSSLLSQEPNATYWFFFLTHWATILAVLYSAFSCMCMSVFSPIRTVTATDNDNDPEQATATATTIEKITWGLFTTALIMELFITVLFWVLVYPAEQNTIDFKTLYEHAILLCVVAFDGLFINRLPIRFKQIFLVNTALLSFLVWTIVHSQIEGLGNPGRSDNDPETDDDALYEILSWNQRPVGALILAALLEFIGIPLFFLICWLFSLLFPHRYLEAISDNDKDGFGEELPEDA